MSKQKKAQSQSTLSSNRNFKVLHQSLSVADINFRRQTITVSNLLEEPRCKGSVVVFYYVHVCTLSVCYEGIYCSVVGK